MAEFVEPARLDQVPPRACKFNLFGFWRAHLRERLELAFGLTADRKGCSMH